MEAESKISLLSIIIPAHNEEDYIEKTILSINNSSYKNFELIVVCDSCTDKTEEISKKYTDKVYNVNFKNIAEARNFGSSKAEGGIFVFCDADTVLSGNYLSTVIEAVNSGFDYGCSRIISETGTLKGNFIIGRFNSYNKRNKATGGNCFVKKAFFNKVKGFDENLTRGEDTDLSNRLLGNGARYIFIKKSYIITSERRFQKHGYFNYFINSMKDGMLYFFNKRKYKEIYKRKDIIN